MTFDENNVFTCKDAKNAVIGSHGYFADNMSQLRTRVTEEDKNFYGKLFAVLDENRACRFDGDVSSIKAAWHVYYQAELPDEDMETFDTSKVYTSVNADDVKIGSKGYFADTLAGLRLDVFSKYTNPHELTDVYNDHVDHRFESNDGNNVDVYSLFYLVEEPEEKTFRPYSSREEFLSALKKQAYPFYVYENHTDDTLAVTRICNDVIYLNGEPISFLELKDNFHFQDGSPCGIEE